MGRKGFPIKLDLLERRDSHYSAASRSNCANGPSVLSLTLLTLLFMLPVFYSSKFHNGPKSLLVKRPGGGGGGWTSFLPASPHIVPPALTCSSVTHIVNGLVMGLQRLLMKRRFCLHTRATRHYPDNSDCGSPTWPNLPHHSASAARFSPASVQIT